MAASRDPAGSSPGMRSSDTQKSRLAAGPSCFRSNSGFELTAALALLVRFLALTVLILLSVRILLLLSWLLAAALLLSGFLARVLVLLARVLVLVGHFGMEITEGPGIGCDGIRVPLGSLRGGRLTRLWRPEPAPKTSYVQAAYAAAGAVAAPGSHC